MIQALSTEKRNQIGLKIKNSSKLLGCQRGCSRTTSWAFSPMRSGLRRTMSPPPKTWLWLWAPSFRCIGHRRPPTSRGTRHILSQEFLNHPQGTVILASHKTGSPTLGLHTRCPPNSMHIVLRHVWQIIINHMANIVHVQPTGSNIRSHQYLKPSTAKPF